MKNKQMTIDNAKNLAKGINQTLLGKREKSRSKGQNCIDKGQLQSHAPVICTLELGIYPWTVPNWD